MSILKNKKTIPSRLVSVIKHFFKYVSTLELGIGMHTAAVGRSPITYRLSVVVALVVCTAMAPVRLDARCIKGNCVNGSGTLVTQSGDVYSGIFKNRQLNGEGKWKSRHGDKYRGHFVNGKSEGKGKLTLSNGEFYIGDFDNGKFHGKGKYTFKSGDSYIGEWRYGKMHGHGTYYYAIGGMQEGEYVDGKLVVQKMETQEPDYDYTFNEGKITSWDNVTKDCTRKGCHNELGIFYYGDGARYVGEFRNGNPEGVGRCEFANGDVYEGEWRVHSPDGKGILTFASGRKHAAIWELGIPKEQLLDDYDYVSEVKKSETVEYDDEIDVYALVVGVASYAHMPSLKYTDDDAYQLYAFLKSPEGGAIPNENIKVLVDDVATKNNILMSMEQLFSKADANDVVMLYMSGHGLEGSFIPSDFDGFKNQLSYNSINEILDQSQAKHKLLIADACHSGSLVGTRGSNYAPALNNYYNILENLESGGTAMLLSSAAKELSLEYSGLRQGVFTHFLMNGLRGSADTDENKVVTISELYAYMYDEVRSYTQNAQSPILTGSYNRSMPVAVIR